MKTIITLLVAVTLFTSCNKKNNEPVPTLNGNECKTITGVKRLESDRNTVSYVFILDDQESEIKTVEEDNFVNVYSHIGDLYCGE